MVSAPTVAGIFESMTEDPTEKAAAAVQLVVPAELDQIADVRRQLTSAVLTAGDDRSLAEDIALAASELSTNVIRYASTDAFSVSCVRTDSRWILEVSHADGIDLARRAKRIPNAHGGRGLMIVSALMDTVELIERPNGMWIRCTVSTG